MTMQVLDLPLLLYDSRDSVPSITHSMKACRRDARVNGYVILLRGFVFACDKIALWTYIKPRDLILDAFGNI